MSDSAAYTPPLEVIRRSLNQLTDHGSQKCLDCLHYRDQGMDALARAFRDLEAAALKYVPRGRESGWSAWNNQDGHGWPELRKALDAIEEARQAMTAAWRQR